jgi:hypothetical protein
MPLGGKRWSAAELSKLIQLRLEGITHNEIAEAMDRSMKSIEMKVKDLIDAGILEARLGTQNIPIDLPIYTETAVIEEDCIIIGDVHIPTTFWELAEMVDIVADLHLERPRTLIIAGDFINADAVSTHRNTVSHEEFVIARDMLKDWTHTFDRIILLMGNHEMRIFKQLYGSIGEDEIQALFTSGLEDIVEVYNVGQIVVNHNNILWRITHQAAYSKIKGRVANILANKHHMNIISHHEHHVLVSRDDHDNYTIINNGGLHDHEKMAYVNQFDNTRSTMNNGFVMLRDGYPYLFTPYRTMTDWESWGIDASALFAAMDARISRRVGLT